MPTLTGGCHCGNIKVSYETTIPPEQSSPRACQCSFCRKHQTRAVSDSGGKLTITVDRGEQLSRYQFSMKSIEFLVCRECGVYVAGFMADPTDQDAYATLMVSALDERQRFPDASPINYDNEDREARATRRRRNWTPAALQIC